MKEELLCLMAELSPPSSAGPVIKLQLLENIQHNFQETFLLENEETGSEQRKISEE